MGEPRRGTSKGRSHSRRDPAGGSGTRYYLQGDGEDEWFKATDWQEKAIDYYKLYESRDVQEVDSDLKGYHWLGEQEHGKIMKFTHDDQDYILTKGLLYHDGELKILHIETGKMRIVFTAEEFKNALRTQSYDGYHHKGAESIVTTRPDYEQYCLCCRCGEAFVL